MNQQRQTTPATIDLTPAHQVLRARIMGAIDCDPRFRIKSLSLEGNRTSSDPFSTGSDTIANHCATSDLLVSFDGSTTYMLQCEVKTTRKKFGDKTAPEIFRDIKHVEYPDSGKRNLRQFEKLCGGGSHYWWYVIAQVHGLNEDDHDLLESKIGDQPAILVEGKAPYPEAMRQYGPMRLNALLKVVRERTGALAEMFPMDQKSPMLFNPPSRDQLALPMDDVPVVTMNDPLYHNPRSSSDSTESTDEQDVEDNIERTPASNLQSQKRRKRHYLSEDRRKAFLSDLPVLASQSSVDLVDSLIRSWDKVGDAEMQHRVAAYPAVQGHFNSLKDQQDRDYKAFFKSMVSPHTFLAFKEIPNHQSIALAFAVFIAREESGVARCTWGTEMMPEALHRIDGTLRAVNVLNRTGYDLLRSRSQ
ncbi:MAG: hypothetical protein ACO4AM_07200 [Candidatus Nanopelagicaceae bacterium]